MASSVCATLHANVSTTPTSGRRCKYTGQSVRALPIRLITVGKNRSRGVQLIVDDYIGKLKRYCTFDDVQIKSNPKNARDVRVQVDDEDAVVMNLIRSDDWVVMVDENGLDVGSEQMAELVGDAGNTGASRLSFCIGGPYGHGRQMRERANISIKLSSMVLNHQIALLVLMEQLYRLSVFDLKEAFFSRVGPFGSQGDSSVIIAWATDFVITAFRCNLRFMHVWKRKRTKMLALNFRVESQSCPYITCVVCCDYVMDYSERTKLPSLVLSHDLNHAIKDIR